MPSSDRASLVLELFEKYYQRVYRFARGSLDTAEAEDIAQDVFMRLLKCQDLEKKSLTSSYLIKIADNLIKRRYRQSRRREEIAKDKHGSGGVPGRAAEAGALRKLEREEDRQRCVIAHRTLADRENETLRMIVAEGLTYQAAAASLGVNVTSVNNWKYRGIQRLKQHDPSAGRDDTERTDARRGGGSRQRAG
jgi:RNA polymerase sigma-70 factor (ECF subfamily)